METTCRSGSGHLRNRGKSLGGGPAFCPASPFRATPSGTTTNSRSRRRRSAPKCNTSSTVTPAKCHPLAELGAVRSRNPGRQSEAQFVQGPPGSSSLRVAQAYFDVLFAEENLRALEANKTAIAQQLESAKRILRSAPRPLPIPMRPRPATVPGGGAGKAAASDLEVKRRSLEAIIGRGPWPLKAGRGDAALRRPSARRDEQGVEAAEGRHHRPDSAGQRRDRCPRSRAPAGRSLSDPRLRGQHRPDPPDHLVLPAALETDFKYRAATQHSPSRGLVASRDREAVANAAPPSPTLAAKRGAAVLAARQYHPVVNGPPSSKPWRRPRFRRTGPRPKQVGLRGGVMASTSTSWNAGAPALTRSR